MSSVPVAPARPSVGPRRDHPGDQRSRRLDVLVVMPHAVRGGQEEWLLQLVDATDRLQISVVLLQDGPMRSALEERGFSVAVLPVGTRPVDVPLPVVRLAARLRSLAVRTSCSPTASRRRWWPVRLPVSSVCHSCSPATTTRSPAGGQVARFADRVVGPSDDVLAAMRRPDAVVIPPPLPPRPPLSRAEATDRLRKLGVPSGDRVLGMLTRLVGYKGVEDAIRALALPSGAGWRLAVLGGVDPSEPDEQARLTEVATSVGVAERVHRAADALHAAAG